MNTEWRYSIAYIASLFQDEIPSEQRAYEILKEKGIVDDLNRPMQNYIDLGYLELQTSWVEIDGENVQVNETHAIGSRGLYFVEEIFGSYFDRPNMRYIRAKKKKKGERRKL